MKPSRAAGGIIRVMLWLGGLLVLFSLWGCNPASGTAPNPTVSGSQTATANGTQTINSATPDIQATPSPGEGQAVLTVWLPPQFHLSRDTEASRLLQARIDAFENAHTGLQIEVRAKAESGEGGMLNTLAAANSAAPAALPDLVLLPRILLESAALKGYLRVMDDLGGALEEEDWFDYAREMGRVQNSIFGIPFAGDLLVMVYDEQKTGDDLPQTWAETLAITHTLGFSAGDPQAMFTIALYNSAGGTLRDEQGLPMLDEEILTRVLDIYAQANRTGHMPFWLMQYSNDNQTLDLYRNGQVDLLVTWRSALERGLGYPAVSNFTSMPTEDGEFYSLASGYVWVLTGLSTDRQMLALELAKYLSDPTLQAEWNLLTGYLPPRQQALEIWPENAGRAMIQNLSQSAQLSPSMDLLETIGPLLKEAAQQALLQQIPPQEAARLAVESLKRP